MSISTIVSSCDFEYKSILKPYRFLIHLNGFEVELLSIVCYSFLQVNELLIKHSKIRRINKCLGLFLRSCFPVA